MKSSLFLCLFLLIVLGSTNVEAQFRRNYFTNMAVDADVQEDFYKRYPDLRDESDVVSTAARALNAERVPARDDAEASELLATRVRAIIGRRSQRDWEAKALSMYPELGVPGSDFNSLFLRHVRELEKVSPQFMQEPSWPVLLARRCADELQPKTSTTNVARTGKEPASSASATTAPGAKPATSGRWWTTWPSVIVLVALIALPATWLLRCSRAFAGTDGSQILWQRALQPTAWAYLAVALLAMWRTFTANADLGVIDRFGITLLVSLLTGAVFAVLAYGVSFGGMWWWRRRSASTIRTMDPPDAVQAGERKA